MSKLTSWEVEIQGAPHIISFPAGLEEVTQVALSGSDYPIVLPPDYDVRTIVDAGSNVGAAALAFANRHPTAAIHCFEPFPETFSSLERNIAGFSRIRCYPFGLSDRAGIFPMFTGVSMCAQNSLIRSGITRENSMPVWIREAKDALSELGLREISILKIDTEGCELQILRDLFCADPCFTIDAIQLEYHSEEHRIAIDRLLVNEYFLVSSSATKIHRGRMSYARKTLFRNFDFYYRIAGS